MKRSLAGSSLCLLLLSGYAATNAGVALAAAPALPSAPATPASSLPVTTPSVSAVSVSSAPVSSTPASGRVQPVLIASSAFASRPATATLPEPVLLAGLTPTQFVPYAAAKIRAAQTEGELLHFERYFLNYHSELSAFLAGSSPITAIERDRYQVATQVMALMREMAAACKAKREATELTTSGYAWEKHFRDAEVIANEIERPKF